MLPSYTELHCLSNFSFLRGASHPEELVEQAVTLGYRGLAITDEASFAGVVRAHLALRRLAEQHPGARGFQLICGTECRLDDGMHLVLLAQDRQGYGNLSELITMARRRAPKGHYQLDRQQLLQQSAHLQGTLALLVPPENHADSPVSSSTLQEQALWLAQAWPGRSWMTCSLHCGPDDHRHLQALRQLARQLDLPLVATGHVLMHRRARKPLLDALTAIRLCKPLSECGSALPVNTEASLRPVGRLQQIYPADLLFESTRIAAQCRFSLDELRYEYPEEIVPPGETPASHLRRLVGQGAAWRYPGGVPPLVAQRIEHELALIAELHYEPYFLTVHDIVQFARQQQIVCQGRGSAANSVVCYCLGITAVDPDRLNTLFERFISRERNEPPDIDVDFEHHRREEVMQYIFAKYGRERAALTAALHTYHLRGAVRDLGRAMGFLPEPLARLGRHLSRWENTPITLQQVHQAGLDSADPRVPIFLELLPQLLGFPRHLSQHSGGFVIARHKLSRLVPIENAAMPGRTVIQWDKDDLDAMGLLKIDVLALGMLSCLKYTLGHAVAFARQYPDIPQGPRALPESLDDIPENDDAVYDMLCRGDALGVFQVESRAQMNMLPRLRPRCYYDLVIQVAIVRPGPIQGGMVHPYLRRRQGLEAVEFPSEAVRGVLERTQGVSIFQEQVMQLAVVAAGFTPGEADQLRRSMASWKRKGSMGPLRTKLVAGMLARAYQAGYIEQILRQIEGFGEYGFPESHAASFALIVYQSAWFRCHFPAAFYAALLNAQPMGFYAPAQIINDARRRHVMVLPVCVNASDTHATLQMASSLPMGQAVPGVRLGLCQVRGLAQDTLQRLVQARGDKPYQDLDDLMRRVRPPRADLLALASADALLALAGHRRQGLWQVLACDPLASRQVPLLAQASGVESVADQLSLPLAPEAHEIVDDYRHTGLSLRRHPLALLRPRLLRLGWLSATQVEQGRARQLVRICGLVTCRQRPATASGVTFVTLEDETGVTNVIVWKAVAQQYRRELLEARLLTVYGRLERAEGSSLVTHVIAARLVDQSAWVGDLMSVSHDFR